LRVVSRLQSEAGMQHGFETESQGAAKGAEGERAMKTYGYTYEGAREASERVHWKVEDLIGGDKHLDFSKPFMPDYFARVESLTFLSPSERLALNQIRGLGYLYTFGLVE
jgi:hypothetical protein